MTYTYREAGNLLDADVEALVNTVNTVGHMGKGLALQFRKRFKLNYDLYRAAAENGALEVGRMFVTYTGTLENPRFIINFPTKRHWRGRGRLEYVQEGLQDLLTVIRREQIKSIAIPALGCGYGGLDWGVVRPMIEAALAEVPDVRAEIYGPASSL